ncbi:MAG: TlpA disulfide reductase family protein [candidate division WOR-3 bacterium]
MIGLLMGILMTATAPDFTLEDTDGNSFTLSELVNSGPVLMVFWATWCTNCKDLLDYSNELYKANKDKGLMVLGISQDSPRKLSEVKSTKDGRGWKFPVLLDPDKKVSLKYKAMAVPVTVIVDKNMEIVYQRVGFTSGQEEEIKNKVQELLGQ